MSSEEDDYMSDTFLTQSVKDVRPGLITKRIVQREIELETKRKRYNEENRLVNKSKQQLEQERRDEGMSKTIPTDNKGFMLLTKMGYKQGESIGKSSNGIIEPIKIEIKDNRTGFGREAAIKQLKLQRAEIKMKRLQTNELHSPLSTSEFRKRIQQKADEKQIEINLTKCQRICLSLDMADNIEMPTIPWLWPPNQNDVANNEEIDEANNKEIDDIDDTDDVEYKTEEKLEMLTNYLRTTYCFCYWCGIRFTDIKDMDENCPGTNKDDH